MSLETIRDDIAHDLPCCPRCGAPARRVEYRCTEPLYSWLQRDEFHYHSGHVECSEGPRCYRGKDYVFPEDPNYHVDSRKAYGSNDAERWQYIDSWWIQHALSFQERKTKKQLADEERERRRCACGCLPKKGSKFCPECGQEVVA